MTHGSQMNMDSEVLIKVTHKCGFDLSTRSLASLWLKQECYPLFYIRILKWWEAIAYRLDIVYRFHSIWSFNFKCHFLVPKYSNGAILAFTLDLLLQGNSKIEFKWVFILVFLRLKQAWHLCLGSLSFSSFIFDVLFPN